MLRDHFPNLTVFEEHVLPDRVKWRVENAENSVRRT